MNVLMIGGTGVLSTAVTNEALKQGIHVVMINRGHRKELIPDGVELIKSDKNDFNRICSLLGERKFDAVIDFLCYNDKETTESFNFYSHYTKQYFLFPHVLSIIQSWQLCVMKILQKSVLCGGIV